jgi:hypothetical protein
MKTAPAFAALAVAALVPAVRADAPVRPRLLLAERDPFSGIPALKARYAAGARPSDDGPGWALSYLLTGDESFARRAVAGMQGRILPTGKSSSRYMDYMRRALEFDWLYGCACFDAALKDRVAAELVDGAARMLALQSLADPAQASFHNHTTRELAQAVFALTAVEGHPSVEARAAPLRAQARRALDNILETTDLVDPEGGYHESMDYMRITFAPLALMAELRRTTTGEDPARRFGVFRNMGPTYLYKVLPDGSTARDDDNEFPQLDDLDNVVLGYAVHRFKDPFAAWFLKRSGWLPAKWRIPVLEFLWGDDTVAPRDPAATTAAELPRTRFFPGVGHLILRDGWGPDSTWVEFTCGPYFAKHDHLDTNHFVIYHRGQLALDSGADYTDTESPHYLNYYRRTIAHNTLLVYKPGETFFWGENLWTAANDGGQRMDSSRFWNSVRSLEDFRRTRDLWDRGRMEVVDDSNPEVYTYARGDGTRAYHPGKLDRFVRELAWLPRARVLFVLDHVRSTDPSYRKAWLLHGVSRPHVDGAGAAENVGSGGARHREASVVTFEDGQGRLRVHTLLPREREVIVRGGPGFEFWTPGNDTGGAWGTGRNWPLDPAEGGPLPADPYLSRMWRTFWGQDFGILSPSNRRAVVPGAWRMEVTPAVAARDDVFLNVLEIGDVGAPVLRIERVYGHGLAGAVVAGEGAVLFATAFERMTEGEITLPDVASRFLLLAGLVPGARYDVQLTSGVAPGSPVWRLQAEANDAGVIQSPWDVKDARVRVRGLDPAERSAR